MAMNQNRNRDYIQTISLFQKAWKAVDPKKIIDINTILGMDTNGKYKNDLAKAINNKITAAKEEGRNEANPTKQKDIERAVEENRQTMQELLEKVEGEKKTMVRAFKQQKKKLQDAEDKRVAIQQQFALREADVTKREKALASLTDTKMELEAEISKLRQAKSQLESNQLIKSSVSQHEDAEGNTPVLATSRQSKPKVPVSCDSCRKLKKVSTLNSRGFCSYDVTHNKGREVIAIKGRKRPFSKGYKKWRKGVIEDVNGNLKYRVNFKNVGDKNTLVDVTDNNDIAPLESVSSWMHEGKDDRRRLMSSPATVFEKLRAELEWEM